jgi:HEPN domain-containing protein
MAFDLVLVAATRKWLALAKEDLAYAAHALTAQPPFLKPALFHCQQAAEKSFKAFLTSHDARFRRVHDLDEIGQQCVELDPSLGELVGRARSLTAYASGFRYPGTDYLPTLGETESAIALAKEVLEKVISRLPDDFHL